MRLSSLVLSAAVLLPLAACDSDLPALNPGCLETSVTEYQLPGDDDVWGTEDDVSVFGSRRMTYDDYGRLTEKTWFDDFARSNTEPPISRVETLTYRAGLLLERRVFEGPGVDEEWHTPDDVTESATRWAYEELQLASREDRTFTGPDGVLFTDDDEGHREQYVRDAQGRVTATTSYRYDGDVYDCAFGLAGAECNDEAVAITYRPRGYIAQNRQRGPDETWGTEDDDQDEFAVFFDAAGAVTYYGIHQPRNDVRLALTLDPIRAKEGAAVLRGADGLTETLAERVFLGWSRDDRNRLTSVFSEVFGTRARRTYAGDGLYPRHTVRERRASETEPFAVVSWSEAVLQEVAGGVTEVTTVYYDGPGTDGVWQTPDDEADERITETWAPRGLLIRRLVEDPGWHANARLTETEYVCLPHIVESVHGSTPAPPEGNLAWYFNLLSAAR